MNESGLEATSGYQTNHLEWYGPYRWLGDSGESLFASPVRDRAGIYLWAVPFGGQNLVYYVGETGRSFAERLTEHAKEYLGGGYRVYDPPKFAQGVKELIWEGMWKSGTRDRMGVFLDRYHELAPVILRFLGLMKVFLAPTDVSQRVRQRIEAAVALSLRQQPGIVGQFQDSDVRYLLRLADEEPVAITMTFTEPVLGLGRNLQA